MKKLNFIAVTLLVILCSPDLSAQNFLKELGKTIEKEVGKEVGKKFNQLKEKAKQAVSPNDQEQTTQEPASQDAARPAKRQTLVPTVVEVENNATLTGKINNHEWVDLGLPSGTLWATCNVDAAQVEQAGSLFAWDKAANSSGKDSDVAAAKWGNGWRMPTKAEFDELLSYCNWKYVQKGNRWGSEITSPINGKSIFLPATGYREGSQVLNASGNGMYWTSTAYTENGNNGAYMYQFGGALGEVSIGEKSYGLAVRPVADNKSMINTPSQGQTGGHQWVDLGLPSGTKWATCNLGAATSEHLGDYFQWAEIATALDKEAAKNETRGKWMSGIGGSTSYDAAAALWGEGWRMPTKSDFEELMNNCTWEWTSLGRRTGCKVTSKINGNYIFLPAGGSFEPNPSHSAPNEVDKMGYYWASTPSNDQHYYKADAFLMTQRIIDTSVQDRRSGFTIRPVIKE